MKCRADERETSALNIEIKIIREEGETTYNVRHAKRNERCPSFLSRPRLPVRMARGKLISIGINGKDDATRSRFGFEGNGGGEIEGTREDVSR